MTIAFIYSFKQNPSPKKQGNESPKKLVAAIPNAKPALIPENILLNIHIKFRLYLSANSLKKMP